MSKLYSPYEPFNQIITEIPEENMTEEELEKQQQIKERYVQFVVKRGMSDEEARSNGLTFG